MEFYAALSTNAAGKLRSIDDKVLFDKKVRVIVISGVDLVFHGVVYLAYRHYHFNYASHVRGNGRRGRSVRGLKARQTCPTGGSREGDALQ
jgi:hypothetical protein